MPPMPLSRYRLELISHHLCPYVQRAVIALTEKNVVHQRTYVDLADKPAWFSAISPLGKVPLLRVKSQGSGEVVLFESAVICEYLEDTEPHPLHPSEPVARARHRAWIEFASSMLADVAAFYNAKDEVSFEAGRLRLAGKFAWLERHLAGTPYFAGARFALVDAAFAPLFRYFDVLDHVPGLDFFTGARRLHDWRAALAARASVRDAVAGDFRERLVDFLSRRDSHLSRLLAREGVGPAAPV